MSQNTQEMSEIHSASKIDWNLRPSRPKYRMGFSHRVVSTSDSQSICPGFESRSDYYLYSFHGSPEVKSSPTLVNS